MSTINDSLTVSLKNFLKTNDINFNNLAYYMDAISQRTYLNEHDDFKVKYGLVDGHNERLEYLGDSTLGHAIAEEVYLNHPGREGDLTDIKIHYVEGNKLARVAEKIGLDKILLMGNGEYNNESGWKSRNENAVEALIGAIDLDQGYIIARQFIKKYILDDLDIVLKDLDKMKKVDNPIGYLQELCVKKGYGIPDYDEDVPVGLVHELTYSVNVIIAKKGCAEGIGKNKKAARKAAAMNALNLYFSDETEES